MVVVVVDREVPVDLVAEQDPEVVADLAVDLAAEVKLALPRPLL